MDNDGLGTLCLEYEIEELHLVDNSGTLNVVIEYSDISCYGAMDGTVEATIETVGGEEVTITSYQWSDGLGSNSILEGLGPGAYSVTITGTVGGNTCTGMQTVTLTEPNELTVDVSIVNGVGCGSDGQVLATASGGTGDFAYEWTDSESNVITNQALAFGLSAGDYTVIVMGGDCSVTATINIPAASELIVGVNNVSDASCHDSSDGAATVVVTNGTPPYIFEWSDNLGNDSIQTNLPQGMYTVTVKDNNMCEATIDVDIIAPDELMFWPSSQTQVTCFDSADGSATIMGNGGTSPYEYLWPLGGTGSEEFGLEAGDYIVTVTDAKGCTVEVSIFIDSPPPITIDFETMSVTCFGDSDGSATIYPDGGSGEFTYGWSSGGTQATESNLAAGEHSVIVVDSSNCPILVSIIIPSPELLTATIVDIFPTTCYGYGDGRATVFDMGGTGTRIYLWDNGEAGATAVELSAGEHSVTITDQNECEFIIENIIITEPAPITINFDITNIPCEDGGVGELEAMVEGGTAPYNFFWAGNQSGELAEYETPGAYNVFVSDDNGCTETADATLPLNSITGLTDYPDVALFQNGAAQDLEYISGIPTMTWQILETENIDTTDTAFETGNLATNPLNLSFVLEEQRTDGFVLLEVYPQGGLCVGDTVQTLVRVVPGEDPFFAPEIFSPNSDGTNDAWEIVFPPASNPADYSVVVYGKNGQKVYEATTMGEPWRGDGCPDGAYYYIIKDEKGKAQYRGAISILR